MFRKHLTIIKNILLGDPAKIEDEKLQEATHRLARCIAEVEFNRRMVAFYAKRMCEIDPRGSAKEAWEFAAVFQKRENYEDDMTIWQRKTDAAVAAVDARAAQYDQVRRVNP